MEETNFVDSTDSQQSDVNFRHYLAILLKRKWLILSVVALSAIGTVIYCALKTPLYNAKTTLYIDTANYSFMPDVVAQGTWSRSDTFMTSQYKIITSKIIAVRVAKKLNLRPSDLVSPTKRTAVTKPTEE